MNKTVVSFADGVGNYMKSLNRLDLSLQQVGFDGQFKGINDYGHINSPLHRDLPYAFKPYSIKKAIEEGGELILWADSPIYAIKPMDALFKHIEEKGYIFFDNIGYTVGDYTSDACLNHFGISRKEAFEIPMIMACCMGFNVKNEKAAGFLDAYIQAASDGITYPGAWSNANCEVSYDLRVKGHRHDQSVASILIHKMGLDIVKGNDTFFMYFDHIKIMSKADSVCLLSQGI